MRSARHCGAEKGEPPLSWQIAVAGQDLLGPPWKSLPGSGHSGPSPRGEIEPDDTA